MIKKTTVLAGAMMLAISLGVSAPVSADSATAIKSTVGTQVANHHMKMDFDKTIIKRRTIFRCISTGLKKIKKNKGNPKKNARLALKNAAMLSNDLKKLFPNGSHKGMTRAKKDLWKDWGKFEKQAASLKKASANLSKVVNSGGDVKKALKGVYKNCKACHKPFRGKKKKGAKKVKCK